MTLTSTHRMTLAAAPIVAVYAFAAWKMFRWFWPRIPR